MFKKPRPTWIKMESDKTLNKKAQKNLNHQKDGTSSSLNFALKLTKTIFTQRPWLK
jgi:hypothetical protein